MSVWSRFANVFRGERLSRELDEELESHIAEALEQGRDPDEARRLLGVSFATAKRVAISGSLFGSTCCAPIWYLAGGNWRRSQLRRQRRSCRWHWPLALARQHSG